MLEIIKPVTKYLKSLCGRQSGLTLIELLVSLAIMGMTVAFIGGVFTALTANEVNKESINAQGLAKSQMEAIMKANYVTTDNYTEGDPELSYEIISVPAELEAAGYEIYIFPPQDVPNGDENIQKIIVEVRLNEGEEYKTIFKIIDYKLRYD